MLEIFGGATGFEAKHWEDPIIKACIVMRSGEVCWPPPPAPQEHASITSASTPANISVPVVEPPQEVSVLITWLQDHQHELVFALGMGVVVGLGLTANLPEKDLKNIGYFALSLLIGHFTVAGVTPA